MRVRVLLGAVALLAASCGGDVSPAGVRSPSPVAVPASPSASPSLPTATSPSPSAAPTTATSSAVCGWRTTTTYRHVVWIWMENRSYDAVLANRSQAPHLSSYARKCGLATRYFAITHPSLPNYLAATQGSTGGVTSNCSPSSCPQHNQSLFGQVAAAGKQWRAYAESMDVPCEHDSHGGYAAKHNPAVYYPAITSQCASWNVPMGGESGAFARALASATLPAFAFVTPNLCHDGHDCSTIHADSWLGAWLDRIVASPAYRAGDTVVFVTWDEGVGSNQRIATVVIGPTVPAGTRVADHFTHYSLLRTTEELLGLPLLRNAARALSMRQAFRL